MKKRLVFPCFAMLFLLTVPVCVQAESDGLKTESVTLTEENRYEESFYQELEVRYPKASARMYGMARSGQSLEEYIVDALKNFQEEIDVSSYAIPSEQAQQIYFQILNSHPDLFYVEGRVGWSYSNGIVYKYKVSYLESPEEAKKHQAELEAAAAKAVSQVDGGMSQVEKALAVHDYIIQNCEYDYENYLSGPDNVPAVSHTAYGSLVEGIAVCDGYANAFSYIMEDKLGISCEVVSSSAMAHAWNMIEIDGQWYHVDATWDDPTWDCIGRVAHNYFLLSDGAIGDANHGHVGWTSENQAASERFDNEFWQDISSQICYYQGAWYYSKFLDGAYNEMGVQLLKRNQLLGGSESQVYKAEVWGLGNSYYPNSFLYPVKANEKIYFNTKSAIYSIDPAGQLEKVYEPQIPSGQLIYGFTVRGRELWYALQDGPLTEGKQQIFTYTPEELLLPEIEGVSAEDVTAVYDGSAHGITVKGTLPGDVVLFIREGGAYDEQQPQFVNAGTYQVSYKVERNGCQPFFGSAQVKIDKASPQYVIPTGLRGESGKTLASVVLPKGFVWQTNKNTKLQRAGTYTWYAKYEPEDVVNYKTVTDIALTVTVSCPGHQYQAVVAAQATEQKKGLKKITCKLCGDSYTEEIPMLAPQRPVNVSGLKVTKNTANSLAFSWNQVSGTNYRLVLLKGNKVESTKYSSGNSCSYSKLKAAAEYTLKVTPYRTVNGEKIYAASEGTIKTATAPAAVKLSKAKRNAGNKVKLTWKKTSGASGYEIYMKTGKGSFKKIKTINNGKTTSFTKTKLKKGKTYSFRLRAYKSVNGKKVCGAYSNVKKVK